MASNKDKEHSLESDPLVEVSRNRPKFIQRRRANCCVLVVVMAVAVALIVAVTVGFGVGFGTRTTPLYKAIKVSNLMQHLQELDDIAKRHPSGSRAVQYAYNDSAEMMYEKLKDAGYENVSRQYFTVGVYEDLGNSSLTATISEIEYTFKFLKNSQYSLLRYSGSTEGVTGQLDVVEGSGCEAADYVANTVALVNYSTNETLVGCSLFEIAVAAESAGVVALVMARMEDDPSSSPPAARIFQQTPDEFNVVDLPLLGATYQLGQTLRDFQNLGTVDVSMVTYTSVTMWDTYNILAYTNEGYDDSIVVVGSHLDSVPAGPGINDDGSGSSANLEMALQVAAQGIKPVNKVLFAFWGAEELGLLGSYHFVKNQNEDGGVDDIALYLNFDMIGSPNYIRYVYHGAAAQNEAVVPGSEKIQNLFEDYFDSQDLHYGLTPFGGGSDYVPFIQKGIDIPAGGLFTGAGEIKNSGGRSTYGGFAGAATDPCYHQACDTVDNIDREVIEQMGQAAASVLDTLMMMEDLRDYLND